MNARIILCFLITTAAYGNLASAATYYVKPTGKDSNLGTLASPFQTIQAAAKLVNPGDTVIVANGTYATTKEALVDLQRGGSAGKPVTFKAENPKAAILDGSNNAATFGIFLEPGVSYVNIQGFEMRGFSKMAIDLNNTNTNVEISQNHIHHIGRMCTDTPYGLAGIYVKNAESITITGNTIHDIGRYQPGENGCNPRTIYYKNYDHGIYLNGASNVDIKHNAFDNIKSGWSIQIYSGSGILSTGVNILNNVFSSKNPYKDGQIIFGYPGAVHSTVEYNNFIQPSKQAILFDSDAAVSNIEVNSNRTFEAVISKAILSGVTFTNNNNY